MKQLTNYPKFNGVNKMNTLLNDEKINRDFRKMGQGNGQSYYDCPLLEFIPSMSQKEKELLLTAMKLLLELTDEEFEELKNKLNKKRNNKYGKGAK